ncbi:glycoside hydrolase family 3 C-terminal domain-containing protein [Marispirochaeta sp.]|uniref:glycoside hydrolase family 3 C-terminal domain-containing protein n=1 Tax=Marispirochaeta sp. TaxID=2038653 RepID=UPI0029C9396D|nr:glycoside hydrolase family 3 C-terminal domain-containing protein [Marispirochaeta sp.]
MKPTEKTPYLTGRLGAAFIRGLQGADKKYLKTAACAKHFAVHSGPEAERHSFDALASAKDMRETYLPAFRDAVKEAGVESVMGAYNRTNGEPCCGSPTLLQKILREEWGFTGHVVSDCWAIKDFHEDHKITNSPSESIALAMNNGCDLNCGHMYLHLMDACREGLVSEKAIDQAVTRLMITRMKLGMFDDPGHVPFASIPYGVNDSSEHRDFALEVSRQSLVLLKNDKGTLPLDTKSIQSIAVIGPNADNEEAMKANYCGTPSHMTTVLKGIQQAAEPDTRVFYAEGCHLYANRTEKRAEPKDRLAEAVAAARMADVAVVCLGLDPTIEGEEIHIIEGETAGPGGEEEIPRGDKKDLNLPGQQQELLEAVCATGKPVILVLLTGSALSVTWADRHVPAIVLGWYPGAEGSKAIASLLFGEYSPSGKLPVTFYASTDELPDFKDYSMKNRTYRYMTGEALYPFGFGLSYTSFEYRDLSLGSDKIEVGDKLECRAKVKNSGSRESGETVQMYLKDMEAGTIVPNWELKAVRKLNLKPGEETEVRFTLTDRHMTMIDDKGRRILEPGQYTVYIGGSQPDKRSTRLTGSEVQSATFEVRGIAREYDY